MIMDNYEQKYKKALEAVKFLQEVNPSDEGIQNWVKDNFPELKDSEGEKIRKDLIEWIEEFPDTIWRGHYKKDVLAWLEKQTNTSNKEYVFRPLAGDTIEKAAERAVELGGKVVLAFNGAYIPVGSKTKDEIVAEYRNWLEKQGEQKPYGQRKECEDCQFNYAGECKGFCQMKRDEQEPVDEAEPKFHIGDKIRIFRKGAANEEPMTITKIDGKGYWSGDLFLCNFTDADRLKLVEQNPVDEVEPKFKVGDIVQYITDSTERRKIEEIDTLCNMYHTDSSPIMFEIEDEWKVVVNAEDVEQEPADNVEPKFHEGDWIVLPLGIIAHVDSLNSTDYQVTTTDGKICDFKISKQDNYHLWTIADAKDGDILATWAGAFIYNGNNDGSSCPGSYCGINTLGRFQIGGEKHWTGKKVYPATKEQRDVLFQKMKEADCKWDSEKKELKTIDQKHVDKVKSKFKVDNYIVLNDDISTSSEIWKVINIDKDGYYNIQCITNPEYDEIYRVPGFVIEQDYRLWTIQDAKDGDVLVDVYGNIGIFDKCYDFDWMSSCSLGNNGGFQYFTVEHENEKTYPATKEQRELLFQKMKEEGWEYDNEKKELKKIEPKKLDPDKVIEWLNEHVPTKFEDMQNYVNQFKKDFKL